jgi:hypothetical protein
MFQTGKLFEPFEPAASFISTPLSRQKHHKHWHAKANLTTWNACTAGARMVPYPMQGSAQGSIEDKSLLMEIARNWGASPELELKLCTVEQNANGTR